MDWIDQLKDARAEAIEWLLDFLSIDIFTLFLIIGALGLYRHRWTYVAYWEAIRSKKYDPFRRWTKASARRPSQRRTGELLVWEKLDRSERTHAKLTMLVVTASFVAGLLGTVLEWEL